jgi:hypothetical protein
MTIALESAAATIREPGVEFEVDEAHLAAVSFLARHGGRTFEAYRPAAVVVGHSASHAVNSSGRCSRHVALVDPRHQPATWASRGRGTGAARARTGLAVGSGAAAMIPPTSTTGLNMCSHQGRCWWARRDSNPRLLPCKGSALTS